MHKLLIGLITFACACFLSGCMILTPIVKPIKYYSPRYLPAEVVDYIPDGTIFIGYIKIVPGDDAFIRSYRRKSQAIIKMQKEAAKVGADYVMIKDIQKNNKDYFFDVSYSDGYTIEGEMFRLINE